MGPSTRELAGNPDQVGDGVVNVIDCDERARALCGWLRSRKLLCGLDTETVGCNPKTTAPARGVGRVVCWSIAFVLPPPTGATGGGSPSYVHGLRHSRTGQLLATRVFLWAEQLQAMRPWLEDPSCPKVGYNFTTYDDHLLRNHGIKVRGVTFDGLRASKLKNPSKLVKHDLKSQMYWRLGYKLASYKDLFSRPKCTTTKVMPAYPKKVARRKVGEHKNVPTIWQEGAEVAVVSWAKTGKELIPLDQLRTDYPRLLPKLYDYASLDAKAHLEVGVMLRKELEQIPWVVGT